MRRPGMVSHSESSLNAISRISPPQLGHAKGNSSPSRAISFAQASLEVSVCILMIRNCWTQQFMKRVDHLSLISSRMRFA